MQESKSSVLSMVKSAFTKACFCLGLGTAAYFSFSQLGLWTHSDRPQLQSSKRSDLQSKLIALQNTSAQVSPQTESDISAAAVDNRPGLISQVSNPLHVTSVAVAKVETPSTEALTTAAPSPSVSPAPDAGTETKEAKGDGEGSPATESVATQALIPNSQAAAFGYLPGYGMTPLESVHQETVRNADSNSKPAETSNGTVATGVASASAPASSPTHSGIGSNNSFPSTPAPALNIPSSFLSQADLSLLAGSMKATFADQTQDVSGLVCTAAMEEGMVTGCRHQNHASVHTSRWDTVEGLSPEAGFQIRSSSASNQLDVTLNLKVQNLQQNFQNLSASAHPTEVLVHGENRGGRNFRIFELRLPNLNMRGTDLLKQVVATLVYEVTPQGSVLSSESSLSFSRDHFHTSQSAWESAETNRAPAANENVVVPENVSYSIKLEKSGY